MNERSKEEGLELEVRALLLIYIAISYFTGLLGELVSVLETSRDPHSSSPVEVAVALVVGEFCQCIQGYLVVIFIPHFKLDGCAAAKFDIYTCEMEATTSVF